MRTVQFVLSGLLVVASLFVGSVGRSAEAPPAGITRDQATQLLDTLKDPEKRERFTATLQAYAQALPPGGSVAPAAPATTSTPGPAPAPPAAAKKPHGPSPLKRAFSRIQTAGARLAQDLRSVTDLPALSIWLGSKFDDADERSAFNQGSLRIALIFAITIGVEALLRWVIRPRPRQTLRRLSARFSAILGAVLAGNAAIMLVADLPVARTVAFGVVNTYVALRFMLSLQLPAGLRPLLVVFLIVVALQLLSGDITDELGAPDFIQEALAKCIALVAHIVAICIVLLSRPTVSSWIQRRSRPGTYWAAVTEALAAIWPTVAICAIAGSWLVWALDIPDAYREIIRLIFATLAVLLVSRFVSNLALKGLDRRMTGFSNAPASSFGSRLFGYRNAARLILQILLVAATLLALTEAWGLPSLAWLGEGHPGHRFAAFTLQLLLLAIVGIICWEGADLAFERRVNSLMDASSLSRATRLRTLQPIIRLALLVLIALLVVMTALDAVGINVGPLLAGASIVGVALGFGSQKLVQDFITGIFLLVEDAMDVGDSVTLAGVSGTVEHISIRTIRLRAGDGSVHLVPFSSVTSVNNTNRGLGNAAVTVNVDPCEDTDRVSALLAEIAREMRQEPQYTAVMQSDFQLWGVDKVDGSMVTIAGQIVCSDTGRWSVQREFNRRMKLRFEREGVKLAVPKQTLRIAEAPEVGTERRPARRN